MKLFSYIFSAAIVFVLLQSCKPVTSSQHIRLSDRDHRRASALLKEINELNGDGKYAAAIRSAQDLLEIVESEKGPDHPGVASALNVLGGLHVSLGGDRKALPLLERAEKIIVESTDRNNRNLATSYGLLAKIHLHDGNLQEAEGYAAKSYSLRKEEYDQDHLVISTSLVTLGDIYFQKGSYFQAEKYYHQALELRKKKKNAHSLVIVLNKLAELYYDTGDYAAADKILAGALGLAEGFLSAGHVHLLEALHLQGLSHAAQGRREEAISFMKRAHEIETLLIENLAGYTSEGQKITFLKKSRKNADMFLSLLVGSSLQSASNRRDAYDLIVRRKGIVLDMQKEFQLTLLSGNSEALEIFDKLAAVRSQLSRLAFLVPRKGELEFYLDKIQALTADKEKLEMKLRDISRPYQKYVSMRAAASAAIAESLPHDSALIEIVRVRHYQIHAKAPRHKSWGQEKYYAFILHTKAPGEITFVSLGDAALVDKEILSLKRTIDTSWPKRDFSTVKLAATEAYSSLFAELSRKLEGITKVYIAPDSMFNLLPFEVLRQPSSHYLVEDFSFNYISCGRDLQGFAHMPLVSPAPSVVIGNPDFNAGITLQQKPAYPNGEAGAGKAAAVIRNVPFKSLPGAEEEAQEIAVILGGENTRLLLGQNATETALMSISSPRYLHIATHGFYLPSSLENVFRGKGSRKMAVVKSSDRPQGGQLMLKMENPLLRSGLALAGANAVSGSGMDLQGIVTAEKILNLRLRGTELVVLSACETGLGKIEAGEGVFGLRRAFTQAGARGLVMSMWQVPDRHTRLLMSRFYKNMIVRGLRKSEALREAIIERIEATRVKEGFAHPYYWGAFIFYGDDT